MEKPFEILIIEDSQDDVDLLLRELGKGGLLFHYQRVETAQELKAALNSQAWDLILADYDLPKFSGPAALKIIQERGLDLPFIVVSGKIGEEKAISLLKTGAHDYVMKGNLRRLVGTVERELREAEERRERRKAEIELQETKEYLEKVLEETADAIGIVNSQGYFTRWNKLAAQLYGYNYEEMRGMHFSQLYPNKSTMGNMLAQLHRDGFIRNYEIDMQRKDGSIVPYEVSISLLRNKKNKVIGSITVSRDVSELKKVLAEVTRVNEQLRKEIEERQQVEKTLEYERRRFYSILDELPALVHLQAPDYSVVFANQYFKKAIGDPEGKKCYEVAHNRSEPCESCGPREVFASKAPLLREMQRFDGRIYQLYTYPFTDIDGSPLVLQLGMDITKRKHAEEALQRAKEEWELTFDAVPEMIAILDKDQSILNLNHAMAATLGIAKEQAVGRKCYEVVHGLPVPPAYCPCAKLIADGQPHEAEALEERLGAYLHIAVAPILDQQGNLLGSVHIAQDITERKKAEDILHRAHKEIEQLFESIPFMMIGLTPDGRISHWNHEAVKTLWRKNLPVAGQTLRDSFIHWEWDKVLQGIENCREKGSSVRIGDIRYQRPDGRDGILGISFSPIKVDNESIKGLILLGRDITEQRLLEAQLAQAQKLESIGQLAAGIAHEINTPIQYVGDNIRFLQEAFEDLLVLLSEYDKLRAVAEGGEQAPAVLKELKKIEEQTDPEYLEQEIPKAIAQSLEGVARVAKIVRAMKDFSHPGTGEKTAVDINKAVESTITVARNEWKYVAEMVTDLAPGLPLVPCLPDEFNQVLLNLIINAAHAIGEVMGKGEQDKGTIAISTRGDGDWVEIRVKDTGAGIPEEIRSKVFDPFFTTKQVGKGTGQGLAISHSVIVDKHGGTISFESELGKGTTFIIRLPRGGLGS